VVGVRAMLANKADLAISIILNSSLQVALALTPVLVLASLFMGGAALTLVVSPLLITALALTAVMTAFIVIDGESTWLEGCSRRSIRNPGGQRLVGSADRRLSNG